MSDVRGDIPADLYIISALVVTTLVYVLVGAILWVLVYHV